MKRTAKVLSILLAMCMVFSYYPNLVYADEITAELDAIVVTNGILSPDFDSAITEYNLVLPYEDGNVTVNVVKADSEASIIINGTPQESITLQLGTSETADVTVVVTASDEITQKTYTVHVTRASTSNDAYLSSITTSVGAISPSFNADIFEYDLTLTNDAGSVDITTVKAKEDSIVTINGTVQDSLTLELAVDETKEAVIEVTAQDGITKNIYTVHVSCLPAVNADLLSISTSSGTITPAFSAGTTEYYLTLVSTTSSVTVSTVKADSASTVKINGTIQNSITLQLNSGETKDAVIEVTAQDGLTKKTYSVHVNRQWPSSNAYLSSISMTNGYLYPYFTPTILSYKVLMSSTQQDIIVSAALQDSAGQLTIDGTAGTEKLISVVEGETKQIKIITTSRDGTTTKTYNITIYRQKAGDTFTISSNFLSPGNVASSKNGDTAYFLDSVGKRVIAFNMGTGEISSLGLQYNPRRVTVTGDTLVVALSTPEANADAVAIVDTSTFTLTDSFNVDIDVTGIVADENYIYVFNSSILEAYSRETKAKTSSIAVSPLSEIVVNPVTGYLYGVLTNYVYSFSVENGQIAQFSREPYDTGNKLLIMPDGQHLILGSGTVLTCSTNSEEDLQFTAKTQANTTMCIVDSDVYIANQRLIFVYNNSDFSFKYVITEDMMINNLLFGGGKLIIAQKNTGGELLLRGVNAGTLLNSLTINSEPFTEFYPAHFDINKGEVPYETDSVEIEAHAMNDNAVVSGDIGTQLLVIGDNTFDIVVTDPYTGRSQHYTLKFTRRSSDPPPVTSDGRVNLGFTPLDTVTDPDQPVAYMTEKDGYSLYRVDLTTGEITEKSFGFKAERIAIKNSKLYLTMTITGHQYYDSSQTLEDGYGAVAIIDTETFKTERIISTNTDISDIEVDEQGRLYLAPGSYQNSILSVYENTGTLLSSYFPVYYGSYIERSLQTGRIYAKEDLTSAHLQAFDITDGVITAYRYSSRDYTMTSYMRISPDGQYIFNGAGTIFKCAQVLTDDMQYDGKIGEQFNTICFDLSNNTFYTAKDKTLTAYNYTTRVKKFTYVSTDDFISLQYDGSRIIAVQKKSSGDYYVNYLDDTLLSKITLNGTSLAGFDPNTVEYSQTLTTDADTIAIGSGLLMEGSQAAGNIGIQPLNIGENIYTITVTGVASGQARAYTLNITRRSIGNASLSEIDTTAGTISPSFSADTLEYDLLLDKDTPSVTVTPVPADSDVSITIDGAAVNNISATLKIGESQDVLIDVTANDGYTIQTYILHIKRQTGNRSASMPNDFVPGNVVPAHDGQSVFLIGENANTVYKADCITGETTALDIPGIVRDIYMANSALYVLYDNPEFNKSSVGIIDTGSFTFAQMFEADTYYYGFALDADYAYLYYDTSLSVFSLADHEKLSSLVSSFERIYDIQANTVTGGIYVSSYSIKSYNVINGQLSVRKEISGESVNITVLPDGKHLVLDDGKIYTCSSIAAEDLVYTSEVACNGMACVDVGANELYAAYDMRIGVYDLDDYSLTQYMLEPGTVKYLFCTGGRLITGLEKSEGGIEFNSMETGCLIKTLKINGDAFCAFYPAYLNIDRGEVFHSLQTADIEAVPRKSTAVISGDIGIQTLSDGENVFAVTVTNPDTGGSETYYITINRASADPPACDARVKLGFYPRDTAFEQGKPIAFMTSLGDDSVYKVNYETGEITRKKFDFEPQYLVVRNGKVYVSLNGQSDGTYKTQGNYGSVAVIDAETFTTETIMNIEGNTGDIEVDDSGRIYLRYSSSNLTYFAVFDTGNESYISRTYGRSYYNLEMNCLTGKIYAFEYDDLYALEIVDGIITNSYVYPHEGGIYNQYFRLSPDGLYLFCGDRGVYTCKHTQTGDMLFNGLLANGFGSICFDLNNNAIFTANERTLTAYNYDSRTVRFSQTFSDKIVSLEYSGTRLAALWQKSNGDYYISYLDDTFLSGITVNGTEVAGFNPTSREYSQTLITDDETITIGAEAQMGCSLVSGSTGTVPLNIGDNTFTITVTGAQSTSNYILHVLRRPVGNACLSAINITAGTLSPVFDARTFEYEIKLDKHISSTKITPVLADAASAMTINGAAVTERNVSLEIGQTQDITVQVTASDGYTVNTYKIHVSRESGNHTVTLDSGFTPGLTVSSPDGKAVFMTTDGQNAVYKADCITGQVSKISIPGTVSALGLADDTILVAYYNTEYNIQTIALIDPDTLSITGSFNTDEIIRGLAGDTDYIYAYGEKLYSYSRITLEETSTLNLSISDLEINPVTGIIYTVSSNTCALKNTNGQLSVIKRTNFQAEELSIMPDGEHLVLDTGTILTCSTDSAEDLISDGNTKPFSLLAVDSSENELYLVNGCISVYDASDFTLKRVMSEPASIKYMFCKNGRLIIGEYNASGTIMFRSVNTGALLKSLLINGDVFSDLFTVQMDMRSWTAPFAMQSISVEAQAVKSGAVISGDTGILSLSVGENVFTITVTDTDTGREETYYLTITRRASDPSHQPYDARVKLPFTPMDVVISPDQPVEYMTASDGYSLYRVNYETGEITEKTFNYRTEYLAIKDGKVYVTLTRKGHSSSTYGSGAVAIIDCGTFKVEKVINTMDPYDIEVDEQGRLYISPGSGQFSGIAVYANTGEFICNWGNVYYKSTIERNVQSGKIYYIENSSSKWMKACEVADGVITGEFYSPSNTSYSRTSYMRISPDSNHIFNGSGNVFTCAASRSGDMVFECSLGNAFDTICFDLNNNRFYTAKGKTLRVYNYNERTSRFTMTSTDDYINLQYNGSNLIIIQRKTNGDYYIKSYVDIEQNTQLSSLNITGGTITPVFNADTYQYSVSLPAVTNGTSVTAAKVLPSQTISIDGSVTLSKYISLTNGETKDINIIVTAPDGATKNTYTLHITRAAYSNNASPSTIGTTEGSLSPAFNESLTQYCIVLPNATSSTTISAVKADSQATLRINGVVASSKTVVLAAGEIRQINIEITAQDGITKKTITLQVTREAKHVTGLTVNQDNIEMYDNDTTVLTATVLPDDSTYPTITWSSSNTTIATVDQTGKVTAVGVGSATITATADGKSTTCNITVQPAQYTITALSSNTTYGIVTGNGTYNNGAKVILVATPNTGCRFVRWTDGTTQLSTSAKYTLTANAEQNITAEFAAIGVPTIAAASSGYNNIKLTWTAVTGATGYEVWRSSSENGPYTKLGTASGTTYTNTGLNLNTLYYYKVNAYCTASTATTYGGRSAYAAATPVPAAPTASASTISYNSVKVSWSSVPGASGYQVYRATSQNGSYSLVKTTSSLSYTNTGLGTGTAYYYKVRPYASGKVYGSYSAIVSAKPMLSAVSGVSASAYNPTSVKISWRSVAGRTKYEVWRATEGHGTYTRIGSTSSTYYKDTTCTPFVTYYYQIKVYRTVNRQPIYSTSASPTASAKPILGNVSGLKAAVSSPSSVKLSWSSVTGASGYEVLRSTTINRGYVSIKSTSGRSFTDSNLVPNTTYYYQVRAYRKVGGSIVPSAPSAPVSATPYFGSVSNAKAVHSSTTGIKLTWGAVSGRTGYELYRCTSPDGDFVFIKSTTSTSFTDSGLTAGVTYYYKIVAYRTVNGVKYRSKESMVSAKP